jgi:hypothetical protein
MGFMNGLGRLLQGKPAFVADEQKAQTAQIADSPTQAPAEKVVPRVCIIRSDCRISDGHMELTAHIKNESSVDVYLDNIRIFDKVVEIDRIIKPAQTSDFIVYKGLVMQDENRNKCELKYRNNDGNFFVMHHLVEYNYQHDTYVVGNIKPVGPVNDI